MIAGTHSGVGKTTISIGIMAALKKRGLSVAPFKVGPDYIDPGFHKYVTGNSSYNLDSYLLSENEINYLLSKNMNKKNIGIIEGVMGVYDGYGITSEIGSSAHISNITKTPIILILDGRGLSNSAAALVLGYKNYRDIDIQGVIINRVSSQKHYELLKEIIEKNTETLCLGYMLRDDELLLESRHLGLVPAEELEQLDIKLDKLVKSIEDSIDLNKLIEISNVEKLENLNNIMDEFLENNKEEYCNKRIGVAFDNAFSFYYQDNFDILKALGASLVFFSPLADKKLPENLDSVYIGGGFPEIFAEKLEENHSFRASLKEYLTNGGKCYAECGGLMYLSKGIISLDGKMSEMVGYLPIICKMTKGLQRFGYVDVELDLGDKKYNTKAHEFHHSVIDDLGNSLNYKYHVRKNRDDKLINEWECGINLNNTLAGYPHLYFMSNLELMKKLI